MILKKITLKNIRSYTDQEIVFPEGSTLLAGDIGSGKTSVLLAVEFALFGLQPGQKGASLLRNSAKEGKVSLEIEIDNKQFLIERSLKRGKTVSQEEASITIDQEVREMSVTELKNLVLNLLNYPSEFIKKSNMLYRFTVYTPQEEMKQIILESAEARLDTLRHVFGIDKYKRVKENAEIVRLKLKEEIKTKEAMILDLEDKKQRRLNKILEIEKLKLVLVEIDNQLSQLIESRKKAEASLIEVREKIEEKKKLENEIEKTCVLLAGKREMLSSLVKEEERINQQIQELGKLVFNEQTQTILEKEGEECKKELETLNKQYLELSTQSSSLAMKNSDTEKLRENISKLELCPTCLQNVDANYKANIINRFDSEVVAGKKRIQELTEEKRKVFTKIDILKKKIQEQETKISELKLVKIRLESVSEKKTRLLEIEKQREMLGKDFDMLDKHVASLKETILELARFDLVYKAKEQELELARKNEKMQEIKQEGTKKEIEFTQREVIELEKEISIKEETKKKLSYLISLQDWLTTTFLDIVSFTEMSVMLKLKDEFSKLFNEWFNILVPEIFTLRLDDSFTPIIEQQDYELDYSYLSGGERTAIALAYRLALNQTINSLLSKIKTKDIVILDEPTDGFSEQQLDKMRDVLIQLKVKQLILVSHESKIESFVENIIKFRKESGMTRVEV